MPAGFKVIVRASVGFAKDIDDAAEQLARAYMAGERNCRVRYRTSLTRDRSLTAEEQQDLVRRIAVIVHTTERKARCPH